MFRGQWNANLGNGCGSSHNNWRSGYQYQFTPKHHGMDKDAAQWLPSLTLNEEFAVFDTADTNNLTDAQGNFYGAERIGTESLRELGTRGEQVAKFPVTAANQPWHGYPAWPLTGSGRSPGKAVFEQNGTTWPHYETRTEAPWQESTCMNGAPINGTSSHPLFTSIKIKDFEVSCAEPSPFGPGFAFGSDDGKVKFTDEAGNVLRDMNGGPSCEAINGIANFGASIAVSTGHEVVVRTWTVEQNDVPICSLFPHGAHGIVATPGGYYVAPLGQTGIMMMKAESGPGDEVDVMTSENADMYFYRVLARQGRDGKDLLVCATRHGGIGLAEFSGGEDAFTMRTATFAGFDAVDVCFVGDEPESPAIAAVDLDCSIILSRDMRRDEHPVTIKFANVQGRAYRLLAARGHLFLLTSWALYGLMNLGTRLLQGLPAGDFTTPIFTMPMEAVDASVIGERWLLVVMTDEVRQFDLSLIHEWEGEGVQNREFFEATAEPISRPWKFGDSKPGSRKLAGVP